MQKQAGTTGIGIANTVTLIQFKFTQLLSYDNDWYNVPYRYHRIKNYCLLLCSSDLYLIFQFTNRAL